MSRGSAASALEITAHRCPLTRNCALWLGLFLAAASSSFAEEQWIKLTSPHFEMYTTNGKDKAVEALRTFEEARDFFAAKSPSNYELDAPVEIIAFKSEKQYAPYRTDRGSVAYYQHGHKCDYIVMQELGRDYFPAAIHEYTHLFIEHLDLHLPLWLNEGLGDVYSSLQSRGDKLMVGTPPRARLQALRDLGVLDVRVLLNARRDSVYYTQPQQMAQFYAASWELAHMLLLGKEYRKEFPQFLTQLSEGKQAEQAFADVYHKSLDDVNMDLHTYLASGSVSVTLFDLHLDEKQLQPEISEPSPLNVELVLADLLSTHHETAEQARARLTRLESEMPNNPDVQESLAYLDWQEGKPTEAKQHFEVALQKRPGSANLLFNYAGLLHSMGAPPREVIKVLQRAVELKPDFFRARFNLGMEAVREGDCGLAISALAAIKPVYPDRAFPIFSAEAYCYWRLGDPAEARRLAELAKQYAKTQEETNRAQNLLDQLNRVNPPQ